MDRWDLLLVAAMLASIFVPMNLCLCSVGKAMESSAGQGA